MVTHPLTELEKQLAHFTSNEEGTCLWAALTGHRASSTRAELAAAILALTAPGAVHMATDSMAYQNKAQKIIDGQDMTKRKLWSLQADGDL